MNFFSSQPYEGVIDPNSEKWIYLPVFVHFADVETGVFVRIEPFVPPVCSPVVASFDYAAVERMVDPSHSLLSGILDHGNLAIFFDHPQMISINLNECIARM